jgi:hypothetical protein
MSQMMPIWTKVKVPKLLEKSLGELAPTRLAYTGDVSPFSLPLLGFYCAKKLNGEGVLKALDFTRVVRSERICVISDFSTLLEQESLKFLTRGNMPVFILANSPLKAEQVMNDYFELIKTGRLNLLLALNSKVEDWSNKIRSVELAARLSKCSAVFGDTSDARISRVTAIMKSKNCSVINFQNEKRSAVKKIFQEHLATMDANS